MHLRVRKKKNRSGSISIHIVDRTNREYKVVETLGSSKNEEEINRLYQKALKRINELENNLFATPTYAQEQELEDIFSNITNQDIIPQGDEMIFGRLFDAIGCDAIFSNIESKNIRNKEKKRSLFRSLVLSRLIYPGSKLELIHYLEYFKNQTIQKDTIYRFLTISTVVPLTSPSIPSLASAVPDLEVRSIVI